MMGRNFRVGGGICVAERDLGLGLGLGLGFGFDCEFGWIGG